MELVQQLAPYLLLFHVLCPLLAGVLICSVCSTSPRRARQWSMGVNLLLGVTSLLLACLILRGEFLKQDSIAIGVSWSLPGAGFSPGMMDQIDWGIVPASSCFLAIIPWIGLTSLVWAGASEQPWHRYAAELFLTGSLGLFIVARDVGSLLAGACLTVMLLAWLVSRYGDEEKRVAARLFLTVQIFGLILFAGGIAMSIGAAGVIRSAPFDVPGASSTSIPELTDIIRNSIAAHPAAEQLWNEYRTFPSLLLLCGIVVMGAGFPIQVWMSEVGASAALSERLWLLVWVKGVFLVGLRLLVAIDPEMFPDFGWQGLTVSIMGALFVSSLLLSQAYLPRLQSSAVVWTQQLLLIGVFSATAEPAGGLLNSLISQTAALVLLTICLTVISERYRSIEISSFQGLSERAGWLAPALLVCLFTLTLTPLPIGLLKAWQSVATLLGTGTWQGSFLRAVLLLADLMALAGLARVLRQLCTGSLRLPEMSSGLRERTQISAPTATLEISRVQSFLLLGWGILAILTGFGALRQWR